MTNLKFWLVNAKVRRGVLAMTLGLASLTVLGFMIYSQREVLQSYSWHVNWLSLTEAALVFMIDLLLVASTWAAIMESLGASLPYSTHLRYYCLANVGKRLPGTIWYVAGRGLLYARDGVRGTLRQRVSRRAAASGSSQGDEGDRIRLQAVRG